MGGEPTSTWSWSKRSGFMVCSSSSLCHFSQKERSHNSSILLHCAMAIFAGGSSVWVVTITVIFPPMRSGKSAMALALNGVTRCRSVTVSRSYKLPSVLKMPAVERNCLADGRNTSRGHQGIRTAQSSVEHMRYRVFFNRARVKGAPRLPRLVGYGGDDRVVRASADDVHILLSILLFFHGSKYRMLVLH